MRGKQTYSAVQSVSPGITPADAGKTEIQYMLDRETKDHPRGCGENVLEFQRIRQPRGSPPRMRGKLVERA